MNKKIKQATEIDYDGIHFKSKKEKEAYIILKESGLNPEYEPDKAVLFEGFKPSHPWFLNGVPQLTKSGKPKKLIDWNYTPDFKISLNDYTAYIEIKGYPNDVYPYKRKLFLGLINNLDNVFFFEVNNLPAGLLKSIEIFKKYATIR